MLGLAAGSYAVDTLLLASFAWAQAIPASLAIAYGLAAAVVCGILFALFVSRVNDYFLDPNLTIPQVIVALVIEITCLAYAPNMAFFFFNVLMVVFAFGTLRVPTRQSVAAWLLAVAASGAVTYAVRDELTIPHANAAQILLVWLSYMLTLARCIVLGLYGAALRAKLDAKNRRLASATEQIELLATRDELTGTLNRRSMMNLLETQVELAARTRRQFGIVMLDIDYFKDVNDRHGHAVGDEVLRAFAETAQSTLRANDKLCRYGGEEFLVLLAPGTSEGATIAAERLRAAVAASSWQTIAAGLRVTVSSGVAVLREGEPVCDLLKRADAALYEAKRLGRNRVVVAPDAPAANAPTPGEIPGLDGRVPA
jgi:diguanylate cyclase (GGDEF)-like protein